jgi:hypothetical protein
MSSDPGEPSPVGGVHLDRPTPDTLRVRLTGTWRLEERLPSADEIERTLSESRDRRRIVLDASELNVLHAAPRPVLTLRPPGR